MTRRSVLTFIAYLAIAAVLAAGLVYAYVHVWTAFVQAPLSAATTGSENRTLVTAIVASAFSILVAMITAIVAFIDRSRVLKGDRTKKAYELSTEAAFGMWKAATLSLRLLQHASNSTFSLADRAAITKAFEDAEGTTLLFDEAAVKAFQLLWNESEVIAAKLVACAPPATRAQNFEWQDEHDGFVVLYRNLRQALKTAIGVA